MANSTIQKTIERMIAVLTAVSSINTPIGGRVYGAHPATIQDAIYPCVSIHVVDGVKFVDTAGIENFVMQIDLWFKAKGANASTWDDVMTLWADILSTFHDNSFFNSSVKIYKINNVGQGPQMYEEEYAILHFPSRWAVRAIAL